VWQWQQKVVNEKHVLGKTTFQQRGQSQKWSFITFIFIHAICNFWPQLQIIGGQLIPPNAVFPSPWEMMQQQCSVNFSGYVRHVAIFSWMLTTACRGRVKVRVRISFSVWLVNGYAHVFQLLSVVVVTLPAIRLSRTPVALHGTNCPNTYTFNLKLVLSGNWCRHIFLTTAFNVHWHSGF